jgi:integrase
MIYKRNGHWHLDVTIQGVRYREALGTTDERKAKGLEKNRIAEIVQGKNASRMDRDFARMGFSAAADAFVEERRPHVSDRTAQLDRERLKPLKQYFRDTPLTRINASHIATYQRARKSGEVSMVGGLGVGNRTVNMEVTVLRQVMRRAKRWNALAEDVRMLPENVTVVGKVLSQEQKQLLFETASSHQEWAAAYYAAVVAVNTTCRGVELKHLKWSDVDFAGEVLNVQRSKTDAGIRRIPLNTTARWAFARLLERAHFLGTAESEHYVFPACERRHINPLRPQKSWRTAWRKLRSAAARRAGRAAALAALNRGLSSAKIAYRAEAAMFQEFRFHDLRHQAITELSEGGASDATIMSIAGHLSPKMLRHYSHVRMESKRNALAALDTGLKAVTSQNASQAVC